MEGSRGGHAFVRVRTAAQLAEIARHERKRQALTQLQASGVAGTGNRFVVDLEAGKPTLQLQKVLDYLDTLGLEVLVRPRRSAP